MDAGSSAQVLLGDLIGPTAKGVYDLIAKDPGARYDAHRGLILDSAHALSPRIVLAPVIAPPARGRSEATILEFLPFFVEGYDAGSRELVLRQMAGIPSEGTSWD